jgi:hypothetical protein
MELLAFGKTYGQFDAAALVVHVQRHHGVARALNLVDDFFYFSFVQQQLARAYRVGMDVCGGGKQRADVRAEQIQRAVFCGDVGFLELRGDSRKNSIGCT